MMWYWITIASVAWLGCGAAAYILARRGTVNQGLSWTVSDRRDWLFRCALAGPAGLIASLVTFGFTGSGGDRSAKW